MGILYNHWDDYYSLLQATPVTTTSSSGLETLATISTHEANNKSSTSAADTTLSHMPVVSMSSAAGASSDTEEIQTVAITMEQLEQLKAGGTNIVYMVSGRASRVMKGLVNKCFYLDETSQKESFAIEGTYRFHILTDLYNWEFQTEILRDYCP